MPLLTNQKNRGHSAKAEGMSSTAAHGRAGTCCRQRSTASWVRCTVAGEVTSSWPGRVDVLEGG